MYIHVHVRVVVCENNLVWSPGSPSISVLQYRKEFSVCTVVHHKAGRDWGTRLVKKIEKSHVTEIHIIDTICESADCDNMIINFVLIVSSD